VPILIRLLRQAAEAMHAKVRDHSSRTSECRGNDRWVQKYGAPVEVEKQDLERGTYQRPELYGQPPEMGVNYDAERERPSPPIPPEATSR
jgi:hypothetical protein